jgi:ThiF family
VDGADSATLSGMPAARPQLKPALRRVWRDESTLQLGVDPRHAVLISGLDPRSARLVEELDGTREHADLLNTARRLGVDPTRAHELLRLLERSGVLDDASADRRPLASLNQGERDRLAPDLAAASLAHRSGDGGVAVLTRRRSAVIAVRGAGRVGAAVTTLLAAAGVGTLVVDDPAITSAADVAPAGPTRQDVGASRADAAIRAARRLNAGLRRALPRNRSSADLVVLCPERGGLGDLPDRLVRGGVVHLFAEVRDITGVVGPLVLPGRSSCGRCHDLHRADRDPAWPTVAAQLTDVARQPGGACDVVLATLVAAQAATQVLGHLDGGPAPPAVDGTIEVAQVDGRTRRRGWTMHPLCGCGWSQG